MHLRGTSSSQAVSKPWLSLSRTANKRRNRKPDILKHLSLSAYSNPSWSLLQSSHSITVGLRGQRRQHETSTLAKPDPEAVALAVPAQSHCVAILKEGPCCAADQLHLPRPIPGQLQHASQTARILRSVATPEYACVEACLALLPTRLSKFPGLLAILSPM